MEFVLMIAVLLLCGLVALLMNYWWVLLIIIGVVGTVALTLWCAYLKSLEQIVFAEIVKKTPVIETVSEKTGHTTSYGRRLSYHEHYRDRNVITGYDVTFSVKYKNGRKSYVTCREGGTVYNKLLKNTYK